MKLITFSIIVFALFWQDILVGEEKVLQDLTQWQPIAGQHYHSVNTNLPPETGIKFYFWSGSESCYQLDLALQNWQKQHPEINITRIPLIARPHWRLLAKAWLVAQNMGKDLMFLNQLYEKIHSKSEPINNFSDLEQFISTQEIDQLNFKAQYNSLSINQQLQDLQSQLQVFPITGVPTIIINNRWYSDASTGISSAQLITIIDQLLLEETPENNNASGIRE